MADNQPQPSAQLSDARNQDSKSVTAGALAVNARYGPGLAGCALQTPSAQVACFLYDESFELERFARPEVNRLARRTI